MLTVAHLRDWYLGRSETFIYTTIVSHQRFRPILLTEIAVNLEQFPFQGMYVVPRGKWNVLRLLHRLAEKSGIRSGLYHEYIVRREHVNLLHAHFGPEGVRYLPLKKRLGLPLVTTFYGYDMSLLARETYWRDRYSKLFEHGDLFLVEGPHMRHGLINLGCRPEKIGLLRIPIRIGRYQFRERTLLPDETVRLLFCGRYVEKKGLEYAVRALAICLHERPRLQLRVIGDGELRGQIEALIASLGLESSVVLLGSRSHEELIAELDQAHILLQPSVTAATGDSEGGAPTTVLEAQACGLPVVATRHADMPFVLAPGAGLLVAERSADELAQAIMSLIEQSFRWPEMGRCGRQHVATHHDVAATIPVLEAFYTGLLGGLDGRHSGHGIN